MTPGQSTRHGGGGYSLAPVLAALGAYGGTVWTARSWASCPLGNDASNHVGLWMTTAVVWLCLTLLLLLLQYALRRLPLPGGQWLGLLTGALALTLLYRLGMDWPYHPPGGDCVEGYPLFPFTGKTGPGGAP
ncbi:hypothetical protein ACIQMP_20500 [Streptomyces sp. NPDC091385]|uniref:hypothetical protein n=1 Tax=Streptomyces sp. NPDC091385 TaxID=3365997 RepID=UPI00382081C0